jgi:hypothetical protein
VISDPQISQISSRDNENSNGAAAIIENKAIGEGARLRILPIIWTTESAINVDGQSSRER